jgi:hypothetical protein
MDLPPYIMEDITQILLALSPEYSHVCGFQSLFIILNVPINLLNRDKAIPVTGCDNRLTDGSEVVSLTHRPAFTPRKIPGTHFC